MKANEIKVVHLIILALKDKKPARNHCGHVYMPHDVGMCDLKGQVCLEESYPGVCNIRSEEEADSVREGCVPIVMRNWNLSAGRINFRPIYIARNVMTGLTARMVKSWRKLNKEKECYR